MAIPSQPYTQISVWLDADSPVGMSDREHPDGGYRVITLSFATTTIHLPSDSDVDVVTALDNLLAAALTLRQSALARALAKAVAA